MSEEPIADLLLRVARQDRAAFREVYRSSSAKLAGVLIRMLRDRTEVEDALQDVYSRIWQRAAQFDPARGTGLGWMVAIARNIALDRLRARPEARGLSRAVALDADDPDTDPLARLPAPGPGPEGVLLAAEGARRIIACFDELEADRAAAVRGAYLEGLSYKDLADRFGVPLNTMRTWLRRSLLRLKECLER